MFLITICVLLITLCFANVLSANKNHQLPSENQDTKSVDIPMGSFDNIKHIDLPKPDYKFTYIFKQIRENQAPQVEQRAEEIGKYMFRQPVTATTITTWPRRNINNFIVHFKEIAKAHGIFQRPIIVPNTHHARHHHHGNQEVKPTIIPPPPASKWQEPNRDLRPLFASHSINWNYQPVFPAKMPLSAVILKPEDLNEILKHRPHSNFLASSALLNPQKLPTHQVHLQPTTSETPTDVAEYTKHDLTQKHNAYTHHVPSLPSQHGHVAPTVIENIKQNSALARSPSNINRGSHKFSWDDVNNELAAAVPRVKKTVLVPILSPWYDAY